MGGKNLFLILFLFALVLVGNASAGPVAYGYVTITIVNNPPELENLHLDESSFDCVAEIRDENPGTAKVVKNWYANGVLVDKSNIRYGDEVSCILTPCDEIGQEGATYILEFKMIEPSQKIFLPILNKF